jgi:hypothetical protein
VNYLLASIDYYEMQAKGKLGRIIVTIADENSPSNTSKFIHCPEDNGEYYWRRMNTGKLIGNNDDIYYFLMYSVERMFPAHLELLGKKKEAETKALSDPSRFDNLQT